MKSPIRCNKLVPWKNMYQVQEHCVKHPYTLFILQHLTFCVFLKLAMVIYNTTLLKYFPVHPLNHQWGLKSHYSVSDSMLTHYQYRYFCCSLFFIPPRSSEIPGGPGLRHLNKAMLDHVMLTICGILLCVLFMWRHSNESHLNLCGITLLAVHFFCVFRFS